MTGMEFRSTDQDDYIYQIVYRDDRYDTDTDPWRVFYTYRGNGLYNSLPACRGIVTREKNQDTHYGQTQGHREYKIMRAPRTVWEELPDGA